MTDAQKAFKKLKQAVNLVYYIGQKDVDLIESALTPKVVRKTTTKKESE